MTRQLVSLITFLCLCSSALALDSDRQQPLELSADKAELDNAKGVSVYTGSVVLVQGTMTITGDKLTVYLNENNELKKLIVIGQPATYQQIPEGQEKYVKANAPTMEYYANAPERVELLGGAKLSQGKNTFTGETITYLVQEDRANAVGGKERIKITIVPEKKDPQ